MNRTAKLAVALGMPCTFVLAGQAAASATLDNGTNGRTSLDKSATALRLEAAAPNRGTARTTGFVLAAGGNCLHDNGPPDGDNGYSNATAGVFGSRRTLLDDFTVPAGEQWRIQDFHWEHTWGTLPPGTGLGAELVLWSDAGGQPGQPLFPLGLVKYDEQPTGRTYFNREGAVSWVVFQDVVLNPGSYWMEWTIVGPENNFALTSQFPNGTAECWVNYEDFGGLQPGSKIFGVQKDLNWCLTGLVVGGGGGACCFDDGSCVNTPDEPRCNVLGGEYQGDGTNCDDIDCQIHFGACCFDIDCVELFRRECFDNGGDYQGDGVRCDPNPCIPGIGACCFQGQCIPDFPEEACVQKGGVFVGGSCDGVDCFRIGACCLPPLDTPGGPVLPDPPCIQTVKEFCEVVLMGVFLGPGVPCETIVLEPIHTATEWSHTITVIQNCPDRVCDDCQDGFVDRCNDNGSCHDCEVFGTGECACVVNSPCDPNRACPDGSCPPGFFCCTNTCCGFPICLPVCGGPGDDGQPPAIGGSGGNLLTASRTDGGGCVEGDVKIDPWVTVGAKGSNCEDFSMSCPIPADFFGPGSDPFAGEVCVRGEPIGPINIPPYGILDFGDADTLILRSDDPFDRCEVPTPGERTVDIELIALNLVSIDPITVTFNGGQNPTAYDVRITLSGGGQPGGELTATKTHCNGGTFSSTVAACPEFTFTPVGGDGPVTLDFCADCDPDGIVMSWEDIPWSHLAGENVNVENPVCTDFLPGVETAEPTQDCDCNENGVTDTVRAGIGCEVLGDANGDGCTDFEDILLTLANWGNPGGPGDWNCDGSVDFADILDTLAGWGQGCP